MKSFYITKSQATLLCLILVLPYLYFYYSYFGNNQYSLKLTALFLFGVLLHFFHKIEPGTQAELVFCGKATGLYWEDGYCLVPSILPVLHNFGIYLLWSLKKAVGAYEYRSDKEVSIDHFVDQRRPNYNMNVQATPLQMTASRVSEALLEWITGYEKGNPELLYQRVGFRIILLSIILGAFANVFYPDESGSGRQLVSTPTEQYLSRDAPIASSDGTILVTSSLRYGAKPTMPDKERFIPHTTKDSHLFFTLDGKDKTKYLMYREPAAGERASVHIEESMCVLVPAGRDVYFFTKYRPQFEVNMEKHVIYVTKLEKRNKLYELYKVIHGRTLEQDSASWGYIHDNWDDVDTVSYGFRAKALPLDKIPDPKKSGGGIVCF